MVSKTVMKSLVLATLATALLLISWRRSPSKPTFTDGARGMTGMHVWSLPAYMHPVAAQSFSHGMSSVAHVDSAAHGMVVPHRGAVGMYGMHGMHGAHGAYGMHGAYAYAPASRFATGDLTWATSIMMQAEYNFSDGGGWKEEKYRSTIHVVNVKGEYLVVGRSSCGIRIVKAGATGSEVVNDCGIDFSDERGWDQHRYYSTIQVAVVNNELYVLGRGDCGMYIYRLVGTQVELMNKCDIPFSDDTEWASEPYYSTIHTAIANNKLFITGREKCGVVIYKLDYKSVMEVNVCSVPLADRDGWIFRRFYSTIDTSVAANEVYLIARSFYGIIIYKTIAGNRMTMVSNCDIKFSDAYGWGLSQYYETIMAVEDSSGIFIMGRDQCGMRIYKLIGPDVFTINECDIKFSDEEGWGMKKYYSTIGATVVKDELYVYGRGKCGMYVYKFAPGSQNATELSKCKIPFSDENGWDDETYFSSVQGTAGVDGLLISGRSKMGLSLYEQIGSNIRNVSHWL